MQLILELFKKIFVALQGVYTKAETDAALEALDAKIEANTANDNALANVVKWQSYAAAMQRTVDETTAMQIAEEFERATNEYLTDPAVTKEWYTSSATESTNPHYLTPATKPIVDFNVVMASRAAVAVGAFNNDTNVPIFLPNVVDFQSACYLLRNLNSPIFIGKCEKLVQGFYGASNFDQYVCLGSCDDARLAFSSTKMSANNIAATLTSLKQHKDGRLHTISFTKSPGIASAATVETFTVTDDDGTEYSLANCPIFTTDDANSTLRKSYVLAVAKKGWTVEI